MNTLGLEGERKHVHVNCFLPVGLTRANSEILTDGAEHFTAEKVAPGVVFLSSRHALNRVTLLGGGASYERAYTTVTRGRQLARNTADELARRFDEISDRAGEFVPRHALDQVTNELANLNGP